MSEDPFGQEVSFPIIIILLCACSKVMQKLMLHCSSRFNGRILVTLKGVPIEERISFSYIIYHQLFFHLGPEYQIPCFGNTLEH